MVWYIFLVRLHFKEDTLKKTVTGVLSFLGERYSREESPGERDGYHIRSIHKLFTSYVLIVFHACIIIFKQLQTIG